MKKMLVFFAFIAFAVTVWPNTALAQGGFQEITGDDLAKIIPAHYEVGGVQVPVMKAGAAAMKNGSGAKVTAALLITSGTPPRIRLKYSGVLVSETHISVCGNGVGAGSYEFGLWAPKAPSTDDGKFTLYSKSGDEVFECAAKRDASITDPKPLTVATTKGGAKLTFYQYSLDIK